MPIVKTRGGLRLLPGALCAVLLLAESQQAAAQTVWSGFDFIFVKATETDHTLPENQDRITSNVWLTRDTQLGIFNIATESSHSRPFSPDGTRWATQLTSPGETIAATNWAALTFTTWEPAFGGPGSLAGNITTIPAVVHLQTDDIYLDLQFTQWSQICCGGFAYQRSRAPASPSPTGDYNGNGDVDAADYVLWRKTLNQPAVPAGSGADGDESGTVDTGDYGFWSARFGTTGLGVGGGASSMSVPEPHVITLLAALAMWAMTPQSARACRAPHRGTPES